jgi:hypothetical protein
MREIGTKVDRYATGMFISTTCYALGPLGMPEWDDPSTAVSLPQEPSETQIQRLFSGVRISQRNRAVKDFTVLSEQLFLFLSPDGRDGHVCTSQDVG